MIARAPFLKPPEGWTYRPPAPGAEPFQPQADWEADLRDYLKDRDQTAALHRLTAHLPRW